MVGAHAPFVLGIDGGGTACRVAIADKTGQIVAKATGGSANIFSNFDQAVKTVSDMLDAAAANAGLSSAEVRDCPAVLGLAGVNIDDHRDHISTALGLSNAEILTDSEIALEGALGSVDGLIGIIGTGSVFLRRIDRSLQSIGGWGLALGDQASGAWLGSRVLRIALKAHDGITRRTPLTRNLLEKFDNDPMKIVRFSQTAKPSDYAQFAPEIFSFAEKGDPEALRIVGRGAAYIEAAIQALHRDDLAASLLGGLASSYQPYLSPQYTSKLSPPNGTALDGAIALARRL